MATTDPFRSMSNGGMSVPSSSARLSSQGSFDGSDDGNNNDNNNNNIVATAMIQDLSCDYRLCDNRNPSMKCGKCQAAFYCSASCQRAAYLDHKPYCFDLSERQRDFIVHGFVDARPYDHKVVADDPTSTASSTAASSSSASSLSNNNNNNDDQNDDDDAIMRRTKALLDNSKHNTLFQHEKEKLHLQAIAQLERIPISNKHMSSSTAKNAGVEARVLLAEIYLQTSQKNNANSNNSNMNINKAKRALFQVIRCEVEHRESSNVLDRQTRDRALESIQRNASSSNQDDHDAIDTESMVLCEELLVSKAVNHSAIFGQHYGKILLLWAQVCEAQFDWARALATYDSLVLLYKQLDEEEQQQHDSTTTTSSSTKYNNKEAIAFVLRATSRCRLKFDDDAISSLLPARQAVDAYRVTPGGHVYLAKTLEAQSNKEELLEEARGVVQRGVLYEAPWDEQIQVDNLEQVAYFKEEIRQAEIRRLKEQEFMQIWGNVLHASETEAFRNARKTWGYTRNRIDMHGVDSDDEDDDDEEDNNGNLRQETERRLRAAATLALTSTANAAALNVEQQSAVVTPPVEEQRAVATAIPPAEPQPAEAEASATPEELQAPSLRADTQSFIPRAEAPSFVPGAGFTVPVSTVSSVSATIPATVNAAITAVPAVETIVPAPETAVALPVPATTAAPAPGSTVEIVDGDEFHDTAQEEEEEKPIELDGDEDFVDDSFDYEKFTKIRLTRDAWKWLNGADGRFRGLFIKKIRKLASGQRTYTTQKNLKGSQSRIYETYLENKSGHRIIWTPDENDQEGLLIWYVVAHKKVSRYMDLIDDAANRSARPVTLASDLPEIAREVAAAAVTRTENSDTGHILLDPKRDIPLKLYELDYSEIDKLKVRSWRPSLHLTPKEREIVETPGTVCVLGRSGTGKTVVVASRIDYDRNISGNSPNFSQLFVARSSRICDYVKDAVGEDVESSSQLDYMTYNKLLSECEKELEITREFPGKLRMHFYQFKKMLNDMKYDCKLDPLVVWTQIRSFIKSSIEAVHKGQPLAREEYLNLGAKQCRLAPAQRELAYNAFEFYQKNMGEWWDDTDRVASILRALQNSNEIQLKLRRTRLYVDEVQDYTQAEIAMFFMLCSPKGLFLAGDPAQSVEEGVDFRFEDVRIVADSLFKKDRQNIPDKPTMLKVNFRSHAGVLNLAAGILDQLFAAFPGSAKELPKDEGLFLGPRPAVFGGITDRSLVELVKKQQGVTILAVNEDKCDDLKKLLGKEADPLTIRDCKGLEFDMVLLVDFFKGLENQQSWKKLLLEDDKSGIKDTTPELEGQLKQLYTAITRCCKRMLFAETGRSVAYDAFIKWAKIRRTENLRLVDEQKVAKVDQIVLTRDEWNKKGVDWAFFAEETKDMMKMKRYMEKAVTYFRNGEIAEFLEQATTHLSSIDVRIELQELEEGAGLDAVSMDEAEFAELMLKLIDAGLLLEASHLCRDLLRVLDVTHAYTRTSLSQRLLPLLPDLDY